MGKRVKKYLLQVAVITILALGVSAVLSGNSQTFAVEPKSATNNLNTLKISPVRSDITVAPGKSAKVTMKVTNLSESPLTVRPIENDFIAGDEKGTPALILDENEFAPTHSLKRFMAPLKTTTIAANATQDVTLVINVPANAKAGGYYGAVRFAPLAGDGSSSVNLNASAASLVLLTVPGDLVEQLELTNFDVKQEDQTVTGFLSHPNNLSLSVRFENKGNVQSAPTGQVYVKQGDKVIYTSDFNQQDPKGMVLPDSARRWDVPLKELGEFGQYTIGATFAYGTKNKSIEVSKTIWIIPTWFIIAVVATVVLLLALIIGLVLFIRRRRSHAHRAHGRGGVKFRR